MVELQYPRVIENAGYPIRRVELAHVNQDFVYNLI